MSLYRLKGPVLLPGGKPGGDDQQEETAKEAQGRLSIVKGWNKRHEKEYAAAPVEIPFPATAGKKAFSPQPMETQPALTVQNGTGSLRTRFTS